MQARYEDLDILQEVQQLDLEVMQTKKARASLPQRIQVVKVRKKRDEILPKLAQVKDMEEDLLAKMRVIEDEDLGLAQKQQRAQEIITAAGADFRKAEQNSKDMAGIAKRRVTLEEELNKLKHELEKIRGMRKQLDDAVLLCSNKEDELKASYQETDLELVAKARELTAESETLRKQLPAELLKSYDNTAKKCGGVALGKLEEGGTCSVCRSVVTEGRLIDLMNQTPLGTCPYCGRLLVIGG